MSLFKKFMLGVAALALTASASAITSISFFGGNNYVIGNKNAWTLEFLYAGRWKYGDNLFFFDTTNPHRDYTTISGEWGTRLSLGKIARKSLKVGPISDFLAAAEINVTGQNMRQYGLGLGTDWLVPHFSNLAANVYWVHNDKYKGSTYQVAALWTMPIRVSDRVSFVFGGLADYYGHMNGQLGDLKANLLLEPSIMFDLGHALNMPKNKLLVGLQYAYWHHMLGTSLNQSAPELKLSWML